VPETSENERGADLRSDEETIACGQPFSPTLHVAMHHIVATREERGKADVWMPWHAELA